MGEGCAPRGDIDGHVGLSRYCGVGADRTVPVGCRNPMGLAGVCGPAKADT